MKTLAIEFSSSQRSIALCESTAEGCRVLSQAVETQGRTTHAFAMIERVLRDAALTRDAVGLLAVGLGPGSYAGIRVSLAIAQGWQLANGIPTIGVSSMDGLAETARRQGRRGAAWFAVDAQRGEFYLAGYKLTESAIRETSPLAIVSKDVINARLAADEPVLGPDLTTALPAATPCFPEAASLSALAAHLRPAPADQLEPIYLRPVNFVKAAKPGAW